MTLIALTRKDDWHAQLRESVRTADELMRALELTPEEIEGARRAERRQPADRAAPLNSTAPTRDTLTG